VTASGYQDSLGTAFERNAIEGEVTHLSTLTAKRAWGSSPSEYSVMLEYLSELKNVAGVGKTQTQSLPLTYSKTVRNIDSLLFPTKGTVWNAQIGGTVWGLSDQSFLRASSKVTHYYRLGKQDTVIVRAEAGVVAAKDRVGIPSAYLFRAGGDQSVRGYAYQELGVQEGDATVGGRYLATASTEYQHWWVPRWGTAIFYDVGNAADRVADLNLKSGYGLGARWKSPVGPINMDVAYGRAVKTFRLHFSLGLSF
jgi:translocation and assembly module TamA